MSSSAVVHPGPGPVLGEVVTEVVVASGADVDGVGALEAVDGDDVGDDDDRGV